MSAHSNSFPRNQIRQSIMALAGAAVLTASVVSGGARADNSGLPDPGFEFVQGRTALLVTDP